MSKHNRRAAEAGLTLMEMTLVVAIISILASIAVPRMAEAIQRATIGGARANLGVIRGALSFYYGDTGRYPVSPAALEGRYLSAFPSAKGLVYHADSAAVQLGLIPSDAGGWSYNNDPLSARYGTLVINCTHTDSNGKSWADY